VKGKGNNKIHLHTVLYNPAPPVSLNEMNRNFRQLMDEFWEKKCDGENRSDRIRNEIKYRLGKLS